MFAYVTELMVISPIFEFTKTSFRALFEVGTYSVNMQIARYVAGHY